MARQKYTDISDERRQAILDEVVDMYIKNDGRMPSSRMVKKNRYITEEEYNTLRRLNMANEKVIQRLAEKKTGKKYLSALERRTEEKRARAAEQDARKEVVKMGVDTFGSHDASSDADLDKKARRDQQVAQIMKKVEAYKKNNNQNTKSAEESNNAKADEAKEAIVPSKLEQPQAPSSETTAKKATSTAEPKKRGKKPIAREEVLEDLKTLTLSLGYVPTYYELAELGDKKKFSAETYRNKLGSAYDWPDLLQAEGLDACQTRSKRKVNEDATMKDALEDLKALSIKLGHVPTNAELGDPANEAKYSRSTYYRYFGASSEWQELLKSEGIEVVEMDGRRRHNIPQKEVLDDLKALTLKLGHIPNFPELKDKTNGAKFSAELYRRELGSITVWPDLLRAEGVDVDSLEKKKRVRKTKAPKKVAKTETVSSTKVLPEELLPKTEVNNEVLPEELTPKIEVNEREMVKIPVKVVVPKGVKGTIVLTLEF